MRNFLLRHPGIVAIYFCVVFSAYSQQAAHIQKVELPSKILNQLRPVYIYTPADYNERDLVSFDVVYVFDAQNREVFDVVHAALGFISLKRKCIVVGVASPAYEELEYYRNSDYLPKPLHVALDQYQTDKPNSENFWRYFNEEVTAYVESNFRTTNRRVLVGHSLSASFVLDKAIHQAARFQAFICVSPNLAYDNFRLSTDFVNFSFTSKGQKKFLYISQSNEPGTWAKPWGMGYEKVTRFIDKKERIGDYQIVVKDFPEYNHWHGYLPAVTEGLKSLYAFFDDTPYSLNNKEEEVTFKVTLPDVKDEVFLVGNQPALGNWDPSKVQLKRVSDYEREITIKVRFPLEFKTTRGSWDSEGITNQSENNLGNIIINSTDTNEIRLKVLQWTN